MAKFWRRTRPIHGIHSSSLTLTSLPAPSCSHCSPSLHEACAEWGPAPLGIGTKGEIVLPRSSSGWEPRFLPVGLNQGSAVFFSVWVLSRAGELYPLGNTGSDLPRVNAPKMSWKKWSKHNHRIVGVGRNPWKSSNPIPCQDRITGTRSRWQEWVQVGLGCLWKGRIHALLGHLIQSHNPECTSWNPAGLSENLPVECRSQPNFSIFTHTQNLKPLTSLYPNSLYLEPGNQNKIKFINQISSCGKQSDEASIAIDWILN